MGLGREILVVEDHAVTLRTLCRWVSKEGFTPRAFSLAREALAHVEQQWRSIAGAIVDVCLSGGCLGVDIAVALRARVPLETPILVVSARANEFRHLDVNIVEKPIGVPSLRDLLRRAELYGSTPLLSPIASVVETLSRRGELKPIEVRIVKSLVMGVSRSALSTVLGMSENTLKWHLKSVLDKLDLRNTDDLLRLVLRTLVPLSQPPSGGGLHRDTA